MNFPSAMEPADGRRIDEGALALEIQPSINRWGDAAPLRKLYLEAVANLNCPWAKIRPSHRFAEYDKYRSIWSEELMLWLYGANPRGIGSLTQFAWDVQHARFSEGGLYCHCLNWSDRNQRVYLGDGLLQYLGLLIDEIRRVYGPAKREDAAA